VPDALSNISVTYVSEEFVTGIGGRAPQFKPIIKSKEKGENCRWNRKHVI